MDYGICLPNFPDGASREGMEAAAETAERLGWSTVWTTDHLLVPTANADDYGRIYEAILSLAWIGAKYSKIRLATSVIVVPMRNAVLLAKELATLDSLSGGRVVAGVGVGWNEAEFANVGVADRFHVRGAYTDETIRLWRHLWSGSTEPFHGRFHDFDDFAFAPLPDRGADLPIVVGGRAEAALRRAGTLGDGYHSSATSAAKYAAAGACHPGGGRGRRTPDAVAVGAGHDRIRTGHERVLRDPRHGRGDGGRGSRLRGARRRPIALNFVVTDPAEVSALAERFAREVAPLV